jgi:hypothetical protein
MLGNVHTADQAVDATLLTAAIRSLTFKAGRPN